MSKPQAYQFCEPHMRPSIGPNRCHECFGAQPNPVNDEPVQKVNVPSVAQNPPNQGVSLQTIAEPVLTDPAAQKIVDAAHNYARAKEAVKILTEQRDGARELQNALQKKLEEASALAEAARLELNEATVKK